MNKMQRWMVCLWIQLLIPLPGVLAQSQSGLSQEAVVDKVIAQLDRYLTQPSLSLTGEFDFSLGAGGKEYDSFGGTFEGQNIYLADSQTSQSRFAGNATTQRLTFTYDENAQRSESTKSETFTFEVLNRDALTYEFDGTSWRVNPADTTTADLVKPVQNLTSEDKQALKDFLNQLLTMTETDQGYFFAFDPAKVDTYYELLAGTGTFNVDIPYPLVSNFNVDDCILFKKLYESIQQLELVVDKNTFFVSDFNVNILADEELLTDIATMVIDEDVVIPIPYQVQLTVQWQLTPDDTAQPLTIPQEALNKAQELGLR